MADNGSGKSYDTVDSNIENAVNCIDNLKDLLNEDVLELTAGNFTMMKSKLDELKTYLEELKTSYKSASNEMNSIASKVASGNIFG